VLNAQDLIRDSGLLLGFFPLPAAGIWTPGGVSSDGTSVYVSTGNTLTGDYWQEGNAVLRLTSAPKFRNITSDYFRPANWSVFCWCPRRQRRVSQSRLALTAANLSCVECRSTAVFLGCRKDYDNRDIDLCGSHPVIFNFAGCATYVIRA
jgi:hypothetical protein